MYLTSCSDNDSPQKADATPLTLSVGLAGHPARAIIEETTLPEGSEIGLFLTDDGGSSYDGKTYANILYTASGAGTSQAWDSDTDIMLSATAGTLHGYYPYSSTVTDITAVPVESASQTDYMYATPVTGVNMAQAQAQVTLNHALTAIKLTLTRGTYSGTGKVTSLSVTSDALATAASLDATTGELSAISGAGTALAHDTDCTLTESPQSTVVTAVPTTATATVTITATVDGLTFTATAPADTYAAGYVYDFRLTVDDKAMTLTSSAVTPWATVSQGALAATHDPWLDVNTINASTFTSGVHIYAVAPNGSLVDASKLSTKMAQQCIAVALIANDAPTPQRLWIEKYGEANTTSIKAAYEADGATNTDYKLFYWGPYGTDVTGINNYSQVGAGSENTWGRFYTTGNDLNLDYTTWTVDALSDFTGKTNTKALQSVTDTDSNTTYANMATWCTKFNQTTTENQGYSDWYIPALGQLALICLNMTEINEVLTDIGGTLLDEYGYMSSSENGQFYYWDCDFDSASYREVSSTTKGQWNYRVRFVRSF